MGIVFMDSFDNYTTLLSKYDGQPNGFTSEIAIGGGIGRGGSNGLYFPGNGRGGIYKLVTASDTYTVGAAVKPLAGALTNQIFWLTEGGSPHIELRWSGNTPYVTRNGTWLATSSVSIPYSSWGYVELRAVIHDSTGSIELRVNGVTTATYSGDTRNGGSGVINLINIGSWSALEGYFYMDDLYCRNDATFMGDIRVEYLVPTGAGAKTQFTPSSGSNWQTVDEAAPSDADYNSASTPGAMDLFSMANLSGNGLVHAVQTNLRARKDDAGFRRVQPVFYKANGVGNTSRFYLGSQSAVGDSFLTLPTQLFNTSPDTGLAWTVDEVNALQYGYMVSGAGLFTLDAKLV